MPHGLPFLKRFSNSQVHIPSKKNEDHHFCWIFCCSHSTNFLLTSSRVPRWVNFIPLSTLCEPERCRLQTLHPNTYWMAKQGPLISVLNQLWTSLWAWKRYKFEFNFLLIKKFRKYLYLFNFILPDYVAHDVTKEFWKITILNIWQLVFFRGLKSYFGILPLKWCIFRHGKKLISHIYLYNKKCSY